MKGFMKKGFLFTGFVAVVMAVAGCTEQIQIFPESGSIRHSVHAGFDETKTVNDGLSTEWSSGDAINVFHAPAGKTQYVSDGKYTIEGSGLASGLFNGFVAESLGGGLYDWYAVYPYSGESAATSGSDGMVADIPLTLSQNGYDSMAHLCGDACPLYGIARNVAGSEIPGMTMNHLTSVIKVEVTNAAGEPVVIENVSFTAQESITGRFYIDLAGNAPSFAERGSEYVSKTVSVTVDDGAGLAAGDVAGLYMPLKPFTAPAGSELSVEVNGVKKTLNVSKDVTFEAGKIKTLRVSYEGDEDAEPAPISVVLEGKFRYSDLTNGKSLSKINETNGRISLDAGTSYRYILDELGMTNKKFIDTYYSKGYDVKFYDAEGRVQTGKADPADPSSSAYPAGIGWNTAWTYKDEQTADPLYIVIYDAIAPDAAGSVVFTFKYGGKPDVVITFKYTVTGTDPNAHAWPAFNPDYVEDEKVDGMTVIRVKGKRGTDGKWSMESELKEHFKEYLNGYESPANHGELMFAISDRNTETIAEISGTDWKDQEIALVTPLVGDSKDVIVEMYAMLANGNRCSMDYVVRFVNPFEAVLEDVSLKTYVASPDEADLYEYLKVVDRDGKAVYEDGAVTSYGKDVYLFEDADIVPVFKCEPDASFGGYLKLLSDGHTLEWYNAGTDLQRDKTAEYGVSVSVSDISVAEAEGTVTVLSTKNSK